MKKTTYPFIFCILTLFLAGCNAISKCNDVDCGTHGECKKGDCECEAGWALDGDGKCDLQDLCYQKDCGPHGTCDNPNGDCSCFSNYQRDSTGKCNKLWRESLIGSWYGSHEEDGTVVGPYTFTILSNSTGITYVTIQNFCNLHCTTFNIPLELVGTVSQKGFIDNATSTCADYSAGAGFRLIDDDHLRLDGHYNDGFSTVVVGNYIRQ